MDLQRAKELLSGLADGVDPLTGEVLPEDHRTMQSSARCSMPEAAERKCVPTSNARRAA